MGEVDTRAQTSEVVGIRPNSVAEVVLSAIHPYTQPTPVEDALVVRGVRRAVMASHLQLDGRQILFYLDHTTGRELAQEVGLWIASILVLDNLPYQVQQLRRQDLQQLEGFRWDFGWWAIGSANFNQINVRSVEIEEAEPDYRVWLADFQTKLLDRLEELETPKGQLFGRQLVADFTHEQLHNLKEFIKAQPPERAIKLAVATGLTILAARIVYTQRRSLRQQTAEQSGALDFIEALTPQQQQDFGQFYAGHIDEARAFLRRRMHGFDEEQIDEVASTVFENLRRNWETYGGRTAQVQNATLFRSLHNRVQNFMRWQRRRGGDVSLDSVAAPVLEIADEYDESGGDYRDVGNPEVLGLLSRSDLFLKLVVGALTDQGFSDEEIAQITGQNLPGAKANIHRRRETLRRLLQKI